MEDSWEFLYNLQNYLSTQYMNILQTYFWDHQDGKAIIIRCWQKTCISCIPSIFVYFFTSMFSYLPFRELILFMCYPCTIHSSYQTRCHCEWIETQEPWCWRILFRDCWPSCDLWSFNISPVTCGSFFPFFCCNFDTFFWQFHWIHPAIIVKSSKFRND